MIITIYLIKFINKGRSECDRVWEEVCLIVTGTVGVGNKKSSKVYSEIEKTGGVISMSSNSYKVVNIVN